MQNNALNINHTVSSLKGHFAKPESHFSTQDFNQ